MAGATIMDRDFVRALVTETPAACHLAQLNIALMRFPIEHEEMTGFRDRLDEINQLADASPGFVWRLQGEEGNYATDVRVYEDPLVLVNLSVWEDVDALRAFTYRTRHVELIRERKAWFHPMTSPHMALWWIEAGDVPSPFEARKRLEHLAAHGPSATAFTFQDPFEPTVRPLVVP